LWPALVRKTPRTGPIPQWLPASGIARSRRLRASEAVGYLPLELTVCAWLVAEPLTPAWLAAYMTPPEWLGGADLKFW
jgi:hypothetical protein